MNRTDIELIEAYKDGDLDAFHQFYTKHKDVLYTFLYNRCREEASDLFQDTFAKFIDAASKKNLTNPKAYLFQIAINLIRNTSRKAKVISLSDDFDIPDNEKDEIESVSEEEFKKSLSSLAQDKPLFYDVLHLHVFGKMTFEEIGEIKEISKDTIASRYRYALKYLRQFIKENQLQVKEG